MTSYSFQNNIEFLSLKVFTNCAGTDEMQHYFAVKCSILSGSSPFVNKPVSSSSDKVHNQVIGIIANSFRPDLSPNCLQRLSADDNRRKLLLHVAELRSIKFLSKHMH